MSESQWYRAPTVCQVDAALKKGRGHLAPDKADLAYLAGDAAEVKADLPWRAKAWRALDGLPAPGTNVVAVQFGDGGRICPGAAGRVRPTRWRSCSSRSRIAVSRSSRSGVEVSSSSACCSASGSGSAAASAN